MTLEKRAMELVAVLSVEEKARLLSGADYWHTKEVGGVPPITLADGPHGLRKTDEKHRDSMDLSLPATCFPPACLSACSFDPVLVQAEGEAIAEECLEHGVSMILGPGVNIKRSPLCGRNFEYFSEDPLVAGELGSAWIRGAQNRGVMTSLKHFAFNNQETRRMRVESVVDERAARELYLAPFERCVKKARPASIMSAYNRYMGEYCGDSKLLLTDILRKEWGFTGAVISDWGGTNNRVRGVTAGLDLEMPGSYGRNDRKVVDAINTNRLGVKELDVCANRVACLALRGFESVRRGYRYDRDAHHALAHKIALESMVLAKNNGVLPLSAEEKLCVVGEAAVKPRYQGSGSSHMNPTRMESALSALRQQGIYPEYARGYSINEDGTDERLVTAAIMSAKKADCVLFFAALPDAYESEGFDRKNMRLPKNQTELIHKLHAASRKLVVVLSCGAPVELPFESEIDALLIGYLGGQAGASATVDLLYGKASPCGKLAESWPLCAEDAPSSANFPGGKRTVEYRESVFVGYRYYLSADRPVRYPFGHGLSYSSFEYSEPELAESDDGSVDFSFTIKNVGKATAKETAQVYVSHKSANYPMPLRELKAFVKPELAPGESKRVTVTLEKRDFSYYNVQAGAFMIEGGVYKVELGASCEDIRASAALELPADEGQGASLLPELCPEYFDLKAHTKGAFVVSDKNYTALLGRRLPSPEPYRGENVDMNTCLDEVGDRPRGRMLAKVILWLAKLVYANKPSLLSMVDATVMTTPLRALSLMSNGLIKLDLMGHIAAWLDRGKVADKR